MGYDVGQTWDRYGDFEEQHSEIMDNLRGQLQIESPEGVTAQVQALNENFEEMRDYLDNIVENLTPDEKLDLEIARELPDELLEIEIQDRMESDDYESAKRLSAMESLSKFDGRMESFAGEIAFCNDIAGKLGVQAAPAGKTVEAPGLQ